MDASSFGKFYFEVHRNEPFLWQKRLAKTIIESCRWPQIIAMPTSSGKTSLIDIAVFLLALEADRDPLERIARLRTFFVIDRRVVVDEAALHAVKLAQALENPSGEIVREVAKRLRMFGGSVPLRVVSLRGGVYRDQTWADSANQPMVCVSTVDQIGTRLLFRGYQLRDLQRPVHAALVAMDSMIILDEAHLSTAFEQSVRSVQRYQEARRQVIAPNLAMVQMTATPDDPSKAFGPITEDLENTKTNEKLFKRWAATKIVQLREAENFEEETARLTRTLADRPGVSVVGIVVNRVASARTIREKLGDDAILLTGRMRPYDRDRVYQTWKPYIEAREDRAGDKRLFVVATQTIEVGANLDFDALISEAAPLDALQQRFGRLDRLGRFRTTQAAILVRKGTLDGKDPVYGSALDRTWTWLNENAEAVGGNKVIDFGVLAMRERVDPATAKQLVSHRGDAPIMFPAHLESWVQTSPSPHPDPDIAPFLHGPNALDAADVQVIWRADLKPGEENTWIEIISAAPPLAREAVPVPIGAVRRWLAGSSSAIVADVEGVEAAPDESAAKLGAFVLWQGPDRSRMDRLYPGATIVVPAEYGGYFNEVWWPESTRNVKDIGDLCNLEAARQGLRLAIIRVHPDVLDTNQKQEFTGRLNSIASLRADGDETGDLVRELVAWLKEHAIEEEIRQALSRVSDASIEFYPSDFGFILTCRRRQKLSSAQPLLNRTDFYDEGFEEEAIEPTNGKITLAAHTRGVKRWGDYFASRLRLPPELIADIALAIELHDVGKTDSRFQAMLHRGNWAKAVREPEPLAKSPELMTPREQGRARERARYPKDARHEIVSAALAEAHPVLDQAHDPDLVLHLIGTHHGYGRPFAPVWHDEEPEDLKSQVNGFTLSGSSKPRLHRLDSDWTDRFWRLNAKYGYWGLAYLEAIVRRADCVQSRIEREDPK